MNEKLPRIERLETSTESKWSCHSRWFGNTEGVKIVTLKAHRGWTRGDTTEFSFATSNSYFLSGRGTFRIRVAEVTYKKLEDIFWPAVERGFDFILTEIDPSIVSVPYGWHYAIVPYNAGDRLTAIYQPVPAPLQEMPNPPLGFQRINAEDLAWDYGWLDD